MTVDKSLLQMVLKYLYNPQTDLLKLKQHYMYFDVSVFIQNIPEEYTKSKYQGLNFTFWAAI